MSAWVVSKAHIDLLVAAGLKVYTGPRQGLRPLRWQVAAGCKELTFATANRVGQMLWDENVRSVLHRYPDTLDGGDVPGPTSQEWEVAYRYPVTGPTGWRFDLVEALKQIDCLEYQSCAHPQWTDSEAHAYCHALRRALICALPGYEEAPWGYDGPRVRVA